MHRTDIPPELLVTAQVPQLLRFALSDWLVIIVVWLVMWHSPWWVYPFGLLVVAGRFHALGVVVHDACHMRARKLTPSSELLDLVAGYPIATSVSAMRYHHLRHHRHNGMALDPYFKAGVSHDPLRRNLARMRGLILVPAWILRSYYGCVALAVPALRTSYARLFLQDHSRKDLSANAEVMACLRQEPKQAAFFAVVLVVAWQHPGIVMAYYFAPLLLAGVLNVNRVIVEHIHIPCADRRHETVAATTVTHDWGAPGKLFLFPRNIGFHAAHHRFPQVALQCLPALHRWREVHAMISASGRHHFDAMPTQRVAPEISRAANRFPMSSHLVD